MACNCFFTLFSFSFAISDKSAGSPFTPLYINIDKGIKFSEGIFHIQGLINIKRSFVLPLELLIKALHSKSRARRRGLLGFETT